MKQTDGKIYLLGWKNQYCQNVYTTTRMDLEIIILREVSERQTSYDITYMWDLKKRIYMNLFAEQKQIHRL